MIKLILISFFLLSLTKSLTIDEEILKVEKYVKTIALEQERLFSERCNTKCPTLSYHACSTILPTFTCNTQFNILTCTNCSITGRLSNDMSSTVKLSDIYEPYTDSSIQNSREIICSSSGLDPIFKKNSIDSQGSIKWQYVGFYDGVFRTYPGRERCTQYDPRIRPWYIATITGAKNLIMILDISNSMEVSKTLTVAKEAAIAVLNTLGNSDWIGLVVFNTNAVKYSDKMVRATKENLDKLKIYINELVAIGNTNFEDAFRKAYEIFNDTVADEYGSGCNNIISFMTDGRITNGEQNKTNLLNMINQLDVKYNATIFTYALGNEAEQELLILIACQHHGIFENVRETINLLESMLSYYRFLSAGIQVQNVVWTEPYNDKSGLGLVTSASYPIYDRTDDPPLLIGVASIDILMDDLLKFEKTDQILKRLIQRSVSCTKNVLNNCQIQSLRSINAKCENIDKNCTPLVKSPTLCPEFPPTVFMESSIILKNKENSVNICCESNGNCDGKENETGKIAGGVIGGVLGVGILIGIAIYIYKKYRNPPPPPTPDPILRSPYRRVDQHPDLKLGAQIN